MIMPRNIFIVTICLLVLLQGQGRPYEGPDDPAADVAAERSGFMTGNRVLVFFRNTTEIGDCCYLGYDTSRWPDNFDGSPMHDGIAVLIGARVYLENDTIPVADPLLYNNNPDLDTLYYIQSSYREFMDHSPDNTVEWGLYPVFGYFNEYDEYPAMSNRPQSWPPAGWPAPDYELKWPGEWNGRFGRGIMKADLESFFVVNDAQDQEYLGTNDTIRYYPRPGHYIGDLRPEVTIQNGQPWGGIGIRISTRGFQWANPQAMDAIFWEYEISNISDYDLPEMFFGYLLDNAVGGESGEGDDIGYYRQDLNLCYSWDIDFTAVGGATPGLLGFAFLESPGLPNDGVDNDNDGLVDEARDNVALAQIGPADGIDDLVAFLEYYNKTEADLHTHWDADEDQDWQYGMDLNNNGQYAYLTEHGSWRLEEGEIVGDDVGLDGVNPFDLNYTGPDPDGTEGNNRPDFAEGVGCEPNFAVTDVSESDMLGLTSFRYLLAWPSDAPRMDNDQLLFEWLNESVLDDYQEIPHNFIEYFASGTFPLYRGLTERVSMAELHSYDPLSGLSAPPFDAPAMFRLKEVVQEIYERDYRFAQPPLTPTLTAIPADGMVILSWDDAADKYTRDSFVGNINDFEGYKIYRATDKKMADAETITDGYGNPLLKEPVFQCDLFDNIYGFTDFGYINGTGYNLGDDSGIQHHWIDTDVDNGRTYYYVLVAYDYGIPDVGDGITPSENTYTLELDEYDNVVRTSINVAVVTPHQFAAGFQYPQAEVEESETFGTGWVSPQVLIPSFLKPGNTYKIKFGHEIPSTSPSLPATKIERAEVYRQNSISVFDVTAGDVLIYHEDENSYTGSSFVWDDYEHRFYMNAGIQLTTSPIDGVVIEYKIPALLPELDTENSGWMVGDAPLNVVIPDSVYRFFPFDYNIVFTDDDSAYVGITTVKTAAYPDYQPLTASEQLVNVPVNFYVENLSIHDEEGHPEICDIIIHDLDGSGEFEWASDRVYVGRISTVGFWAAGKKWAATAFSFDLLNAESPDDLPQPGDVYYLTFRRGFWETDSIMYTVEVPEEVDTQALNRTMDQIKVVPNPYVATNLMEESVVNYHLNQERRLMFTHLPARCTIKIFTMSGIHVQTIEVDNAVENRQSDWDLNSMANGTAFWDLKTKEGLEVAAGWYIYHVVAQTTGKEKVGKFAIVK